MNTYQKGSFIIKVKPEEERLSEMQMFLRLNPEQQESMFNNSSFLRFLVRDVILTIADIKSKSEFQKFLLVNSHLFYLISEHYEDFAERYWNPYITTKQHTITALINIFHQI